MFTDRFIRVVCLLVVSYFLTGASTCYGWGRKDTMEERAYTYEKKRDIATLCVFNTSDKKCWVDKEDWMGWNMRQMDGFFCLSKEDFEAIVVELFECKNK